MRRPDGGPMPSARSTSPLGKTVITIRDRPQFCVPRDHRVQLLKSTRQARNKALLLSKPITGFFGHVVEVQAANRQDNHKLSS